MEERSKLGELPRWGVALPDTEKARALATPVQSLSPPPRIWLPLAQRDGSVLNPVVMPGAEVRKGQLVADGDGLMAVPVHASVSGTVVGVVPRLAAGYRYGVQPHLEIETSPCGDIEEGRSRLSAGASAVEILDRIVAAGIAGLGGAGFPTAAKLSAAHARVDTLLINAVECEPYVSCDAALLKNGAQGIAEGIVWLKRLSGWPRCLVARTVGALPTRAEVMAATGASAWVGVDWVDVPAVYPMGSERQLIEFLLARTIPTGSTPLDVGVLCVNVATVSAIADALERGLPLTHRILTVAGPETGTPRNIRVPIGMTVGDAIQGCGMALPGPGAAITLGGPMAGASGIGLETPIAKTNNSLLLDIDLWPAGRGPEQPCIRCGRCATACPQGLLPQELWRYCTSGEYENAARLGLKDCIECRCCDYVCPSDIRLLDVFKEALRIRRLTDESAERAERAKRRYAARQARMERVAEQRTCLTGAGRDAAAALREQLLGDPPKSSKPATLSDVD